MSVNFPYSANFQGTVSAPVFLSNQVLMAPVAAGTASTLTFGSISGTFSSITQSYAATLSTLNLIVGTLTTLPVSGNVAQDINGPLTILNGVNDSYRMISALDSGMGSATSRSISLGQNNSNGNQAELGFYYVGSNSSLNSMQIGLFGKQMVTLQNSGNVGINTSTPAYTLDINGAARVLGSLTLNAAGPVVNITAANPGDMVVKAYTNPMDRYGFGQYVTGGVAYTRVFASGSNQPSAVSLSVAGTGSSASGTFLDILTAKQINAGTGTLGTLGAVGINNTAPAFSLDVTGSARVTGSVTAGSAAFTGTVTVNGQPVSTGASTLTKKQPWTNVTASAGFSSDVQVCVDEIGYTRFRGAFTTTGSTKAANTSYTLAFMPAAFANNAFAWEGITMALGTNPSTGQPTNVNNFVYLYTSGTEIAFLPTMSIPIGTAIFMSAVTYQQSATG